MLEASWSGRFAGIERFSEPESREKSNAFPRFFEQLLSQTYLLTKMFIDFLTLLQLLLKLASIWFPTSFSASTAPGLVRSLPDWRSHSGNEGRSRMSSAPKAPQYLHVLTVSYSTLNFCPFFYFVSMLLLFQLHAKRAFAPKEAVGLCSCVSSNLSGVSSKYQTLWFILFLYRKSMKEQEAMHKAFLNGCKCTFQLLIEDQTTPPSLTWSRLLQAVSLPSFFKWISKVSRSVDYT
jgi:hypothetical protein